VCQGTHENPELIWNDEAREKVCSTVKHMKDEYAKVCLHFRLIYEAELLRCYLMYTTN